jgi:hypothetical protein
MNETSKIGQAASVASGASGFQCSIRIGITLCTNTEKFLDKIRKSGLPEIYPVFTPSPPTAFTA